MKTDGAVEAWETDETPQREVTAWRAKEILVPTDFSEESLAAMRHAGSLAAKEASHLTVLTVIEEPVSFRPLDVPCRQRCRIESVAERMKELAEQELPPEVRADLVIREGNVASEIAGAAAETEADLIVMGCRRHRGWWRWLRANTARRVMTCAPCPVVVVIHPEPPPSAAEHQANLIELVMNQARQADGSRCQAPSAGASHQTPHRTVSGAHA